jgi:hypothetical protein
LLENPRRLLSQYSVFREYTREKIKENKREREKKKEI